jgi:glucan phosphoethanolaminetransferase (alkaline phosphatase superfamily)
MIQRIQTVFIFIAAIFIGILFFLPIAEIAVGTEVYLFKAAGIFQGTDVIFNGLPIMIFLGIIVVLHLVSIFLYKKRIKQMRILVFSIILMFGLFGIFYYFTYASFENETIAFKIPVAFPLVAIILDYLAIRNIGKDEALVRSLDRIR